VNVPAAASAPGPNGTPLVTHEVGVSIAGKVIVTAASVHAGGGSLVALVGPNGCGKTTLLRAVYRAQPPSSGRVVIGEADVWAGTARQSARLTARVAQLETDDFDVTVTQTVALGRLPHHRLLRPRTGDDDAVVAGAIATAGVTHLADRVVSTLSGGERQRVAVARALAQQTPVIVLDEPTNHLDIRAQVELLDLLTALPATVLVVLHDLNLAAAYADHVFVMHHGEVAADGPPGQVLTPQLIGEVYGVSAACTTNPLTGRPALHFAATHAHAHARSDSTTTTASTTATGVTIEKREAQCPTTVSV
jgi:iron complex transport system ATP-binding protein